MSYSMSVQLVDYVVKDREFNRRIADLVFERAVSNDKVMEIFYDKLRDRLVYDVKKEVVDNIMSCGIAYDVAKEIELDRLAAYILERVGLYIKEEKND